MANIVQMARCELGLAQKEYSQVLARLGPHLVDLSQQRTYTYLPYFLYYQAQALLGQNQPEQAAQTLTEASGLAEKLGSKRPLWPILASLSQLEADSAKSKTLRQQAQEIIKYIADHTPAELRDSFLDLPDVRAVFT